MSDIHAAAKPRILFVDDEEPTRRYFGKLFEGEFDISLAASVDDALALLASDEQGFAILVTDQRMPGGKSGTDLLASVRDEYPRMMRIFSTAFTDMESTATAINRGDIFRYVDKPWDIPRLHDLLREAYRAHLEAEHLHRLIEERRAGMLSLAAGIAHEMRTPLASVQLAMSGLLTSLPRLLQGYQWAVDHGGVEEPLSQRAQRGIEMSASMVSTEVSQAVMIIEAMLMAVRDGEDLQPDHTTLSIQACLVESIERFPFQPRQREQLQLNVERDFSIVGREELVVYVIYNLLRNALYALAKRDHDNPADAMIHIHVPDDGSRTVIIRDTGTGIDDHVLPHIFEDYYTTRPVGVGNGLGLPFCRRVMRAMNGDAWVDTKVGEYTTVTLQFPGDAK